MKVFVVVNPAAGGGLAKKRWPAVQAALKEKFGEIRFEMTTAIGHARLIASEAVETGVDLIVAFGGDGTIHEVVNGIFDVARSPRPTLGILSAGTGSDLIKTLGIPRNLQSQIEVLTGPATQTIDVGKITYTDREGKMDQRIFVNIADAGVGAEVIRRLGRSRKLFGRRLAYLTATLSTFMTWPPRAVEITIDGEKQGLEALAIVVANGRYFGSGMPIAPTADPSDGLFDWVVIGRLKARHALIGLPLLYKKQLRRLPGVRTGRARKIELNASSKIFLDIDGELVGSLPATFEILPKSLMVRG